MSINIRPSETLNYIYSWLPVNIFAENKQCFTFTEQYTDVSQNNYPLRKQFCLVSNIDVMRWPLIRRKSQAPKCKHLNIVLT